MSTRSLISHLQHHAVPAKQCCRCRRDIGQEWRTKTSEGRYICHPCLHSLTQPMNHERLGLFAGERPLRTVDTGS